MKKTIYKYFGMAGFEKEEKWLNEMSAKGLQLYSVGFCRYVFEEGVPGAYTYRLELLDKWPTHPESVQYIRFIEDTGAEQVSTLNRWVYFRKNAEEGEFDLFSDRASRVAHLDRILLVTAILAGVNLFNGLTQMYLWGWGEAGNSTNLVAALFCSAVGALIGAWGFIPVYVKRRRLRKEKVLHE